MKKKERMFEKEERAGGTGRAATSKNNSSLIFQRYMRDEAYM
jgi:hypothetical protein